MAVEDSNLLERINILRNEIQALEIHLDYLRDKQAPILEIGEIDNQRKNLIKQLDKLMGL